MYEYSTSIAKLNIPKDAAVIDVGGGDSRLVDFLLQDGYTNLTVLEFSSAAINRAKARLGENAAKVKWIVGDVLDFNPTTTNDLWHDRAAFHFQTEQKQIEKYLHIVQQAVKGQLIVGTFSVDGPTKCSGLTIKQYDEKGMKQLFEQFGFRNIICEREDHITPSGNVQNFVFCSFGKQ